MIPERHSQQSSSQLIMLVICSTLNRFNKPFSVYQPRIQELVDFRGNRTARGVVSHWLNCKGERPTNLQCLSRQVDFTR